MSGPTNFPEEIDASTDSQTTCNPIPSCPDQTSASHPPAQFSQPEPQTAHIFTELTPPQLQTNDLLPKDGNIPITSALRETVVDELTQYLTTEEQRDRKQRSTPA